MIVEDDDDDIDDNDDIDVESVVVVVITGVVTVGELVTDRKDGGGNNGHGLGEAKVRVDVCLVTICLIVGIGAVVGVSILA